MKVAIFNLGKILTGDLAAPTAVGDTIILPLAAAVAACASAGSAPAFRSLRATAR